MAHQIGKIDWQQGREMAWHNLTDIKTDLDLTNNKFRTYEMDEIKTFIEWNGTKIPTGEKRLVCSDNGALIGKSYADSRTQFSNAELLATLTDAMEGTGAELTSCGTVRDRESRYFSFSIKGLEKFKAGGREFEGTLNLLDDVTGRHPLIFRTGNTCVVCANTFAMALNTEGKAINGKIRHTLNARLKLPEMGKVIEQALLTQDQFIVKFNRLNELPCNQDEAKGIFAALLGKDFVLKPDTFFARRSLNTIDDLTALFAKGAGNRGETMADAFSAVTDYYSHSSAGDDKWKQFVSSEFGSAADAKSDFARLLDQPLDTLKSYAPIAKEAIQFSNVELDRVAQLSKRN